MAGDRRRTRRARVVVLVGALAALIGVAGPGGGAEATAPPPQDLLVSFVGPDGAPVAGACVDVYRETWAGPAHAPTPDELLANACAGEESSSLTVAGVEDWSLRLLVHPPRPFADAWVPEVVGVSQPVVVRLARAGSMSGEVTLADGFTPAAGATVVATRLGVPPAAALPLSATVSPRGSYMIWAAPGRYSLVVRWAGKEQVVNAPGSRHPAEAKVRAGLDTVLGSVTFGPTAKPLATTVRVQVVDVWTRAAVPGVCVVPVVGGGPDAHSALPPAKCLGGAVSDATGLVQLQVDGEGTLPLAAWGRDGMYVAGDGEVTLSPGGTATGTLEVVPYAGLRGRVVDASSGKPIAGVCPQLEDESGPVAAERLTCSDAKGWWEVAAFPAGTVVVVLPGGAQHETRYVPGVATAAKASRVTLQPGLTVLRRTALPSS